MKNAIIIHGRPEKDEYYDRQFPSPSNSHWLPWLQHELLILEILAQTPEMPEAFSPKYEKWLEVFQQFQINDDTILIGHSRGASFLLRYLSENNIKVGKVLLVSPSILPNPGVVFGFSDYEIDQNILNKTNGITMFYSTDDESSILESVKKIRSNIPNIEIREFSDKGHFTTDDGVSEFPEILEEIKI